MQNITLVSIFGIFTVTFTITPGALGVIENTPETPVVIIKNNPGALAVMKKCPLLHQGLLKFTPGAPKPYKTLVFRIAIAKTLLKPRFFASRLQKP